MPAFRRRDPLRSDRPTSRAARLAPFWAAVAGLLASITTAGAAPGVPESRVLPNGLKVVVLEDHTLPLASVSLWVGSGSKYEAESSAGYAHYLEHLIQRGTTSTGPFEFTRRANRWGGSLSVRSNYDRTAITLTGLSSAAIDMLQAAAGLAFHATLKDSEINLELGSLTQEVRTYYDLPVSVAFLETMRAAFPDHPYRWPMLGNFHAIGTLKSEPITAFYRNLYVPNNMALAVVGDVDPKAIGAAIDAQFGAAAKSVTLPPPPAPPSAFAGHADVEKRLEFLDKWTTLSFVGPGYGHPDRIAFEVLAAALADSGSALGEAFARETSGTVAQVSCYGLEDASLLYVALTPSTPELSYTVADVALRALERLKKEGLSDAAVQATVQRVLRDERLRHVQAGERAERLGEAALFGGDRYYWDRPLLLQRLTAADVARVARRYLVAENLRLVILLPKGAPALPAEANTTFHQGLDALGSAGENMALPPQALYSTVDATRVTPGAWGDPKSAAGYRDVARTSLDNGLTILALEDHRQPLISASLLLQPGSGADAAGKEGLAGLTLRLLGARTASLLGGRAGAHPLLVPEAQATRDFLEVRFTADPADLDATMQALSKAVSSTAAFAPADLESARKAALAALDAAGRDPDAVALDLFHEKVYAGHAYAHRSDGTASGLASITAEDVAAFARRVLSPEGAVLAMVGDIDAAETTEKVQRLFASWPRGPRAGGDGPRVAGGPAVARAAKESARAADAEASAAGTGARPGDYSRQMSASQSRVIVGVPGRSLLDPAFDDLRFIGAGVTLMAFEDMVFARRAAFGVLSIPEGLRDGGALAVEVTAAPVRRAEAQFDVQRLMRHLSVEPLSETDRNDLARMLSGREAATAQGPQAVAGLLAWREAAGLGARGWREAFALKPPPADRLRTLAAGLLKPEAWITVSVGPPSP